MNEGSAIGRALSATKEHKERLVGPYQLFMLGLCVYVLLALAYEAAFDPHGEILAILHIVDTAICVIFLADFFGSLITAEKKLQYLKWGWIDLLSSIPMVGPLRWGRLARVMRIVRLLRGVRSSKRLILFLLQRRAQSALAAISLMAIIVLVFSSVLILEAESGANANIKNAEDALWWSFVTMTTVGYGDLYPVTSAGRWTAALLMATGIGLFGTFTGFVSSWFFVPSEDRESEERKQIRAQIAEVEAREAAARALLNEQIEAVKREESKEREALKAQLTEMQSLLEDLVKGSKEPDSK